jgi:hypothetical protein
VNKLAWNDSVVDSLRSALSQGKTGLGDVPAMLKIVLKEQAWKDRVIVATGEHTSFERFEDFAKAAPLAGLGADLALIKRIVRDDPEALDLLDQATENPEGRPAGSHATMASETTVNNVNSYETRESPVGNTSQYAIRRLRKERPDLADERRE